MFSSRQSDLAALLPWTSYTYVDLYDVQGNKAAKSDWRDENIYET